MAVRLLGVAALAGSLALGFAAAREWRISDVYGAGPEVAAGVLGAQPLTPHLSYATTREALTRCMTTLSSTYFAGLADADKSAVALNCRDFAGGLIANNALHAEAHLILALFGDDLRDLTVLREHLGASQKLAPLDRFHVEWRLILAHRAAQWSDGVLTNYDCAADLRLLGVHLPHSRTLEVLRDSNTPLHGECAA